MVVATVRTSTDSHLLSLEQNNTPLWLLVVSSPYGTPILAPEAGTITPSVDWFGNPQAQLQGSSGMYYWIGGAAGVFNNGFPGSVTEGQQIGSVGTNGLQLAQANDGVFVAGSQGSYGDVQPDAGSLLGTSAAYSPTIADPLAPAGSLPVPDFSGPTLPSISLPGVTLPPVGLPSVDLSPLINWTKYLSLLNPATWGALALEPNTGNPLQTVAKQALIGLVLVLLAVLLIAGGILALSRSAV